MICSRPLHVGSISGSFAGFHFPEPLRATAAAARPRSSGSQRSRPCWSSPSLRRRPVLLGGLLLGWAAAGLGACRAGCWCWCVLGTMSAQAPERTWAFSSGEYMSLEGLADKVEYLLEVGGVSPHLAQLAGRPRGGHLVGRKCRAVQTLGGRSGQPQHGHGSWPTQARRCGGIGDCTRGPRVSALFGGEAGHERGVGGGDRGPPGQPNAAVRPLSPRRPLGGALLRAPLGPIALPRRQMLEEERSTTLATWI